MTANEETHRGMETQIRAFHDAVAAGMPRLGWKVALSDPAAMARFGIDRPAIAWTDGRNLLRPGEVYHPPAGAKTRAEAELAVRLGPERAIIACAPAIEFIDFGRDASSLGAILGHAVFHDAVLLGPEAPLLDWPPDDWPTLRRNGEVAASLEPKLVQPDLPALLAALDETLAAHGEAMQDGDIVITGSLTTPIEAANRDVVEIDYGPLGSLTVTIGEPR